jgi:hypothetical protein
MDPVLGVFQRTNGKVGYCSLLVKPYHEPDLEGTGRNNIARAGGKLSDI